MTSEDLWLKCDRPPLMPPLYHKQPRRPRKKRMRSAGEQPRKSNPTSTKLQRYNLETKCSLCRQGDHNRRSCPKATEGTSCQVLSKPKVKKPIDTTSTKRVTRQSTSKQPVIAQASETAQAAETAQALKIAQAAETAQASQTAPSSETAKKKRFKSLAKRIKFTNKKFKSPTKRKKFTNQKDLLDGYQPWRF
ncbi:uncharacterized protein Pyn_30401 [Prunus yedoensis var. nudiflora]|uniref:Uncharacterized protein n=1 Tax=Prunus yedoensis var. nudiflora TaxID=2094558 RepID=A0A314UE45_PRUYE|nr:uncharacterized protein Pyn_30401 [Prunus yedoensis var. nudiflora]